MENKETIRLEIYDKLEELDMRLENLSDLIDILGTYTWHEEDENNKTLGSALDFVSWSVTQLRKNYSSELMKLARKKHQEND